MLAEGTKYPVRGAPGGQGMRFVPPPGHRKAALQRD